MSTQGAVRILLEKVTPSTMQELIVSLSDYWLACDNEENLAPGVYLLDVYANDGCAFYQDEIEHTSMRLARLFREFNVIIFPTSVDKKLAISRASAKAAPAAPKPSAKQLAKDKFFLVDYDKVLAGPFTSKDAGPAEDNSQWYVTADNEIYSKLIQEFVYVNSK